MTPTILTNLALSKIGHTLVKALGDTTSKDARLAALHYEPCLREALRAHFWSFAMTTRPLVASDVREYLSITGTLKAAGKDARFPRLYLQGGDVDGKPHYVEAPDADSEAPVSSAWWSAADTEWVLEHGMPAAQWRRGLDVETPEQIKLRPTTPVHVLETNLKLNNDLRYEQVDPTAEAAAVQYTDAADGVHTKATVTGRTLTIVPARKSRMDIHSVSDTGVNGTLHYAGLSSGKHCWTSNGLSYNENISLGNTFVILHWSHPKWVCERFVAGTATYRCAVTSEATYPDSLIYDSPTIGTVKCVVLADASSALEVMDAVMNPVPQVIRVSGPLAQGGSPVVVPPLFFAGITNGRPAWTDIGSFAGAGYLLYWYFSEWVLTRAPFMSDATWLGDENVATPDLVTTWVPQAVGTTGVPVVGVLPDYISPSSLVHVSLKVGNDGSGAVGKMARASLTGGTTGTPVIRRVTPATELLGWTHAFELPADFIKAKALYTTGGRKIDQFAIRRVSGKTCILCDCDAVSLEYVQYLGDPAAFDPLFVKAFTTLLAAKLARAISGSDDLESRFLQIFETVDLPAARTASGHETDSDENHPLRALLDGTLTPGRGDFFPRRSRTHGSGSAPASASAQNSPNYQTITFDTEAQQVVIRKGGKTIRINGTVDS